MNKRFLLCFLLIFGAVAQAQQYRFTNFSLLDGLAQSQVFCISENKQGYLFFGTRGGGLSRFNGLEFETFSTAQNLSGNYINALFEDEKQTLWVATNLGLSTINGNTVENISFFKGKAVRSILSQKDTFFAVADGVVYQQNNNRWQAVKGFSEIKKIVPGRAGKIWAMTDNSVFLLEAENNQKHTTRVTIESFAEDKNGTLWLGTYGDGLYRVINGKTVSMNAFLGLEKAIINHIFCDNEILWISTLNKGVCVFDQKDSTATFLTEANGLANNHAKVTYKDSWGNIWVGTSGGGVSKYAGQYFKKLTQKNGLQSNYIFQVFVDAKQRKWVATSGGGVTLMDTSITHFDAQNGFLNQKVKAIFQSADSAIWLGTEGGGLAIFKRDTVLFYSAKNGLAGNWVKDFKQDAAGNVWVASSGGGITKFMADTATLSYRLKKITTKNGLISNRVNALEIDSLNRLWYSTQSSGIGFLQGDTIVQNFSTKNGLASNQVRSLHIYGGNLWLGSARGLNYISLYADSVLVNTPVKSEKLASQNVYLLQHDLKNNLWVGTEKGVDRIKLNDTHFLEIKHFGVDDGFDGVETNTNATALDADGNVWFGTINGLFKFSGSEKITKSLPPKLSFTHVALGPKIDSFPQPVLAYSRNRMAVSFIGISQTFPRKVRYKWQLLGLDTAWSAWTDQRSVEFLNLAPGSYTFRVLAKNENEQLTENPMVFTFEVDTPFWQNLWFQLAAIALVLGLILFVFRIRVNAVKRKAKAQNERLALQRKVTQLEQKALQLQMNPHFIFNTLNSIQALIASREEAVARNYLTKFSKLMRNILEGSRANYILLADEIDMLTNYLELEKFCYENGFTFSVKVAPNTESELIKIPSMILQPFVENAILHGATKSTKDGHVSLHFSATATEVICIIEDNGPGLETKNISAEKNHQSHGIAITEERLQLLTKEENVINYLSKTNTKGEVIGLQVLIKLPIK